MLLCVAMVVVAGAQPWLWSWVRIRAADFHRRRSETDQLAQLIERVEFVQGALTKQQPFIDELSLVAPREQDVVRAIEALEQLAASLGLTLSVKSISETAAGGLAEQDEPNLIAVEPLVVSLSTEGGSATLFALIDGIERLPFMTRLVQLKMEPSLPGSTTIDIGQFTLTADVMFFMQRDYGTATRTP